MSSRLNRRTDTQQIWNFCLLSVRTIESEAVILQNTYGIVRGGPIV